MDLVNIKYTLVSLLLIVLGLHKKLEDWKKEKKEEGEAECPFLLYQSLFGISLRHMPISPPTSPAFNAELQVKIDTEIKTDRIQSPQCSVFVTA